MLGIVLVSCKKKGCTDPDATNYDEKAGKVDGSCIYNTNATFWMDANTANNIASFYSATHAKIYVEGELLDSLALADYSTSVPLCADTSGKTVVVDMGLAKGARIAYQIKVTNVWTGNDVIYAIDTVEMVGGSCSLIQIY